VIARVWSAQTTPAQAPAYARHLRDHVLPALRKVPGHAGVMLLERPLPGAVEVVVITFWQSAEAVRGFAGADPEAAVVAEEAAALLTQFDRRVRHYEVVVDEGGQPGGP
jgi:heme-degrading monooxygenase HmoA